MLKETSICSVIAAVGVVLVGFALGWEAPVVWTIALLVAASPFFVAALLQIRILQAIAQSKAESWLGHNLDLPGPTPDVAIELPRLMGVSKPAVIELPEPERVRLIPVRSSINSVKMASEFPTPDGQIVRIVPVAVGRLVDGVEEQDLVEFINGLEFRGHAVRSWLGVRMPSGRVVDVAYHQLLLGPLVKCGAIVDRRPRTAGKRVICAGEIKLRLGLSVPSVQTVETA